MLLRWRPDTPAVVSGHYGPGWYLIKLISMGEEEEEDWDSWQPLSRSRLLRNEFFHTMTEETIMPPPRPPPPSGLHIESNPAHRHCATELRRAAAAAVKQCRGLRLLLLLSDDRGCPLARPTDRVRGAEPDSNLQGEWHAVSTNV